MKAEVLSQTTPRVNDAEKKERKGKDKKVKTKTITVMLAHTHTQMKKRKVDQDHKKEKNHVMMTDVPQEINNYKAKTVRNMKRT